MWPPSSAKISSSKMAPMSPISLCERIVPPSPAAIPADSCPRCCSAYSAKKARRAASWPGVKTPVMPHMRILFYNGRTVPARGLASIPVAKQRQDCQKDVDRVQIDLHGQLNGRQPVSAGADPREINEHQTREDEERQPRIRGWMNPVREDRDDADEHEADERGEEIALET